MLPIHNNLNICGEIFLPIFIPIFIPIFKILFLFRSFYSTTKFFKLLSFLIRNNHTVNNYMTPWGGGGGPSTPASPLPTPWYSTALTK